MGRRRQKCQACWGCYWPEDCMECMNCLDKVKYGGQGRLKQCCVYRQCETMKSYKPPPEEEESPNHDTTTEGRSDSEGKDMSAVEFGYSSKNLEMILSNANTSRLTVRLERGQIVFYKESGEVRVRLRNQDESAVDRPPTPDAVKSEEVTTAAGLYEASMDAGDECSDNIDGLTSTVEVADPLSNSPVVRVGKCDRLIETSESALCEKIDFSSPTKVNCHFIYKPQQIKRSKPAASESTSNSAVAASSIVKDPSSRAKRTAKHKTSSRAKRTAKHKTSSRAKRTAKHETSSRAKRTAKHKTPKRGSRQDSKQPKRVTRRSNMASSGRTSRSRFNGSYKEKGLRIFSCGKCLGCSKPNCKLCVNCLDKPQYGGPGTRKQKCILKVCLAM